MQVWAVLEFMFALVFVIGGITLIIAKLHMIERAEDQKIWMQLKEKVESIR